MAVERRNWTLAERLLVGQRQDWRCGDRSLRYGGCSTSLIRPDDEHPTGREPLEVDHKVPLSQGGAEEITNLQILHAFCHDRKTALEASD